MESLSSDAQLLRAVPIPTVSQWGTLRLDDGRLSFTKKSGDTVFDVPANEIHSVRPMTSMGIHVWHGTTRYRLAAGVPSIPGRIARDATNRAIAACFTSLCNEVVFVGWTTSRNSFGPSRIQPAGRSSCIAKPTGSLLAS